MPTPPQPSARRPLDGRDGAEDVVALLVFGTRPNFMKIAPVVRAMHASPGFAPYLVHTGQHYDEQMSGSFMDELELRADEHLEVGPGSQAYQMAEIITRLEDVLTRVRPDVVVVVGDVTSTLAAALAAATLRIPIAHVEAGLRSRDWDMPEERNRVLTDRLSAFCFTPSRDGDENLRNEGIEPERIHFVGNVMIDSLDWIRANKAAAPSTVQEPYGVVTLHRPSNVDEPSVLKGIVGALERISETIPLVFPVHPRTQSRLEDAAADLGPRVTMLPPMNYGEFVSLVAGARVVLTDSGGIQEETTVLGVPCVTIRNNTERPVTLDQGGNRVVGTDPARIEAAALELLDHPGGSGWRPPLWDGKTAERIVAVLAKALRASRPEIA